MAQPSLEGLPIELRIKILFDIEDYDSLDSLLRASYIYYRDFKPVHEKLLYQMLHGYYDGLVDITESIAAMRSRGLYAYDISNRDKIIALLDSRRRSGEIRQLDSASGEPLPDQPMNSLETISLIDLHEMAIYLLEEYSRTVPRPEWMDPHKWKNRMLPFQLSRTEKKRFFRAFYRLQTWGHIFGTIELPVAPENIESCHGLNGWYDWEQTFSGEEAWRLFFGTMAPWEVEEFGCLWEYCYARWVEPYTEVSKYLTENEDLCIRDLPDAARMIIDACDPAHCQMGIITMMVSMGPAFLVKILREPNFRTRLYRILDNADGIVLPFTIIWPGSEEENPLENALPLLYPVEKFNVDDDRRAFKEILKSLPPHEQPNLAWCQEWVEAEGDYDELFLDMFAYKNRAERWRWGYAFWDDDKVLAWGARSI